MSMEIWTPGSGSHLGRDGLSLGTGPSLDAGKTWGGPRVDEGEPESGPRVDAPTPEMASLLVFAAAFRLRKRPSPTPPR
jgi:hypothetical protein